MASNVAGPIPGTRNKSSAERKGPNAFRASIIARASLGPIRGSDSNISGVAVLTSTPDAPV